MPLSSAKTQNTHLLFPATRGIIARSTQKILKIFALCCERTGGSVSQVSHLVDDRRSQLREREEVPRQRRQEDGVHRKIAAVHDRRPERLVQRNLHQHPPPLAGHPGRQPLRVIHPVYIFILLGIGDGAAAAAEPGVRQNQVRGWHE